MCERASRTLQRLQRGVYRGSRARGHLGEHFTRVSPSDAVAKVSRFVRTPYNMYTYIVFYTPIQYVMRVHDGAHARKERKYRPKNTALHVCTRWPARRVRVTSGSSGLVYNMLYIYIIPASVYIIYFIL